jgi:uncharacterized protein
MLEARGREKAWKKPFGALAKLLSMRHSGSTPNQRLGIWRLPYSSHPHDSKMICSELLKILVCPESQSSLSLASNELIATLNAAIARGQLKNKAGQKIDKPIGGGLVRADQTLLYPIVDEIPMMLVDEGIPLDQISSRP